MFVTSPQRQVQINPHRPGERLVVMLVDLGTMHLMTMAEQNDGRYF